MSQAEIASAPARARAGNGEAWGELYREYAPAVFRLCRRVLPTREDAEDATAEIFLKVRLKLDQYDPARPFAPWLYKLAVNHCWDELRRLGARPELPTEDLQILAAEEPAPGPLDQLLKERTRHDVRVALARLPARARLALVMRYYAELSYEEIAAVLRVRPDFVGVLLLRARRQLRRLMEEPKKV